ncbi:hypothetical protein G6F56_007970 [Rhizopus delemar]|nr:hypothetical protein G6F56_007970 [Rhizopus delemar]
MTKNDDESRAVGSSIDGIITLKKPEIDILLIEVSGPMWKENYSRFLNDSMKIAKNLKNILRKKLVMDEAKDLKLYGMQIYRNKIHVYCLSMPILKIYCFVEIINFSIPTSSSTLSKDFPQYIKYLIKTLKLIAFSAKKLKEYMVENDLYESDDTQTSPLSPPYVSPQKGTKRKTSSVSSSSSSSR